MEIKTVNFCFDGGSAKIETDEGTFYVNRRLSCGDNNIYTAYPGKERVVPGGVGNGDDPTSEMGAKRVSERLKRAILVELEKIGDSQAGVEKLIRDILDGPPQREESQLADLPPEIRKRVEEGRALRQRQSLAAGQKDERS
jgi:hypothetical protein